MTTSMDLSKITGLSAVMFKAIMYKNEKILSKVLEQALNEKVTKIKFLNTEFSLKNFIENGKRLELYLEDNDSYIDVVVTNNYHICIFERTLSHEFKLYINQVDKDDSYEIYKKIQLINLIGNKKSDIAKRTGYLTDQEGNVMSKMLLYSETYTDNLKEMYYNKNDIEIMKNKYLIMLGLTLDELEKFNYEYGDEIVEQYLDLFKETAITEEFQPLFSKEEDERRIRNSFKIHAFKEGKEEGVK